MARRWTAEKKKRAAVKTLFSSYYVVFLLFIYGPMFAMFILSFQGRRGGTSFPMRGWSLYWWNKLLEPSSVGDLQGAMLRSIILALIVMVITALFSTMFAMAFRKRFFGSGLLFYTIMTGIMVPGILLSLGLATLLKQIGIPPAWWSTALGVHVVWTLPFGFLVMMAVFNRFDGSLEEAARDMGASEWTVFKEVTLPLITPGIVAAGLFGFTLSYDEFARTTLLAGEYNTLPLDINASMTQRIRPTLFALGTASTLFSLLMIGLFLLIYTVLARRTRANLPSLEHLVDGSPHSCCKRLVVDELLEWKRQAVRKPLLLDGARQVGKTHVIDRIFGPKEFHRVHRLDFRREPALAGLFADSLNPRTILSNIELRLDANIDVERDLVFFDEVGECQPAVDSLKYFAEELPRAFVCASGSNVGLLGSFPVGKVRQLEMFPPRFRGVPDGGRTPEAAAGVSGATARAGRPPGAVVSPARLLLRRRHAGSRGALVRDGRQRS